jgi:putative CocE/NonD family hydrolase
MAKTLRKIRDLEHLRVPMSDGCELAARMWIPEGAEQHPVPAIIECTPNRRRDWTRFRDSLMHPYNATHGYAALRLDSRGSGDSDGILRDEYLKQEQDDVVDAIAWIAAQPWCTGAVGMLGGSWGGLITLQTAMRRPPALKAIITVDSGDDRYAIDMHFMGGCLLTDTVGWAGTVITQTCRPPYPDLVGGRWREMWMARLRELSPLVPGWLAHPRRDAFWKHGSVCEDWNAIQCAVYAVGGWPDGYTDGVFRLLAGLPGPKKGLVGPWAHGRPHFTTPKPLIGFLQEALRWWDYWLKGEPTGIMDEPMLRVWMQESVPPRAYYDERPGRWVAEPSWPSPNIIARRFAVNPGGLADAPTPSRALSIRSPQSTGIAGGEWCAFGHGGGTGPDLPIDQRIDDGNSLVFDTEPLEAPIEILGAPVLEVEVASDRPSALLAARLSDVAPDGAATRVSYTILNLSHRDSHESPSALEPGRRYRLRLSLKNAGHVFPVGHRVRLALSTTYWPIAFPVPGAATLTFMTGGCALTLPVRAPRAEDIELRPFEPVETAPPALVTAIRPVRVNRTAARDAASGTVLVTMLRDEGIMRLEEIGVVMECVSTYRHSIQDDDPLSAATEVDDMIKFSRGTWTPEIRARLRLSATEDSFQLRTDVDVYESGERVFCRSWSDKIPRDFL